MSRDIFPWFLSLGLAVLLSACAGLSLEARQQLEQLRMDAETAKIQVERKLRENPYSAVEGSLEVLDSILLYADKVKTDPAQFNDDKLREYQQKIQIIQDNLGRFSDLTLQADVSFPLGKYKVEDLSAYAKRENDELVEKILASVNRLETRYPNQGIRITLKIVGYTDETPFTPGTALEKEIRRELRGRVPAAPAARRAAYNRILSRFRADSLGTDLQEKLRAARPDLADIVIKSFGEGETPPEKNASPAYQPNDPRRRVSIVSPFVEIVLQ
jgi:outer membrane protein OmpA-like peptidoglycan-associated protein